MLGDLEETQTTTESGSKGVKQLDFAEFKLGVNLPKELRKKYSKDNES